MGWSPGCYIPSFVEIGLPVPIRFFKGFYHIWAWRLSWSCEKHHVTLYLKAFIQNLVQIGTVVYEKIGFEILYVHDLGQRSKNDVDLQFS